MLADLDDELRNRRAFTPALARAMRQAAGATQAEVAREVGVHRVTIARYELGTRTPRAGVRQRYMALLKGLSGA